MTGDRTWPLESERPGSIFSQLSTVLLWTSHFPPLGFSALVRKTGVALIFQGCRDQRWCRGKGHAPLDPWRMWVTVSSPQVVTCVSQELGSRLPCTSDQESCTGPLYW